MLMTRPLEALASGFRAAAGALLLAASHAALAIVPTPVVVGPVAADLASADRNYTFFGTDLDLKARGYVEEEFFMSGQANSYDATIAGGIGARASASPTANVVTTGNPYTTRVVVRRPAEGTRFSGTVVVEWMNATSNYDVEALWFRAHEFFMREGHVWIGVTAQSGPITNATLGLKQFSPARYGQLDLTAAGKFTSGDPLSYDVYGQALQAVRTTPMLGPLKPLLKKVVAAGVSQSAGRVSVYLNAIMTRDLPLADAALLYIGGEMVRTDLAIPVIKLLSETEYVAPASANEISVLQPDSDKMRTWTIAGASHSDWASSAVRYSLLRRDQPTAALRDSCDLPSRSRVPDRHVIAATLDWLHRWNAAANVVPPTGPAVPLGTDGKTIQRDTRGNMLGGIRVAPFAVPVAVDSGINTGAGTCFLNGNHEPFTTDVLKALYPTRDAYFTAFKAAVEQNVKDGFVMQADADDMLAEAKVSITGLGLDCGPLCANKAQFPIQPSTGLLRDHVKFLYMTGADDLLKSIDAATLSVARGYTAAGDAAKQKVQWSQAAKWLQNFQSQVEGQKTQSRVTTQQAALLKEYSGILVTELQTLGATPDTVTLDPTAVTDLYGAPPAAPAEDSGGGAIGQGRFDVALGLLVALAAAGLALHRRRRTV